MNILANLGILHDKVKSTPTKEENFLKFLGFFSKNPPVDEAVKNVYIIMILMENDLTNQIIAKLSSANNFLILAMGNNGDSLSSALALRSFLKKLDKEAVLMSMSPVQSKFNFLPGFQEISKDIKPIRNFVIDVSTKRTGLAELSYEKENDILSIFLKPVSGQFSPQEVTFRVSPHQYELLILVGIGSLDQLGLFYSDQTDLFFETPILNVDFKASNENFGQFNLINLAASSCSEVVFDLISKFEASLIDETIATQLLAGIIDQTNSFQHIRTTPQAFLKASQLVSLGAKQQEIIANLYKSKSLGLLKLWGRVLARLKQDQGASLVYSAVNQQDIEKAEAEEEDVNLIIREMVAQLGFAKVFLFLKEDNGFQTTAFCSSLLPLNLFNLFSQFNPQPFGQQTVKFILPFPVSEAEQASISLIKKEIARVAGVA